MSAVGTCEGALRMPEEFAFEKVLGDRPAIHRDERSFSPRRLCMDRTSDDFLARAAFAGHENRGLVSRHAVKHLEQINHPV